MSVEVLPQDELPSFHEVANGKVVVEKVLDEKLEDPVVQFEGLLGVDEHPLNHLVQAAGGRWRSKSVESEVASGSLDKLKIQQKRVLKQHRT